MHYEGDERFSQMLEDIRFPKPLREIKAFLRGALAAANVVMPSTIMEILTEDDEEFVFDSKEHLEAFYSNFIGLWNILSGEQREGHGHLLSQETYPCTVSGLIQRIEDREAEVGSFVMGLDLGGTDPDEMSPDGQDAFDRLIEGTGFLIQFRKMLNRPMDQNELPGVSQTLDDLDQVMSDCISRIIAGLEEARAGYAQSLSRRETKPSLKIGRNEPCPCGSGRKFKKCCLH